MYEQRSNAPVDDVDLIERRIPEAGGCWLQGHDEFGLTWKSSLEEIINMQW